MAFQWRKRYSFLLILVSATVIFLCAALSDRIFYTVESGQVGVLYRLLWGTETDKTYGEGLTVIFPWNKLYIYDVREQQYAEEVEVLSYNGLSILVSFSFRFRLVADKVGVLHQTLGPEYLEKLIRPTLIASVREVVGNYRPEELFTTHSATLQDEIQLVSQQGIEVYNIKFNEILVKAIKLPGKVENAIQDKLVLQQVAEGYDYRLVSEERERQRKTIQSDGIRIFHETIDKGLSPSVLSYLNIDAMRELAESDNSKVVVLGNKGADGLMMPLMMDDLNRPNAARSSQSPGTRPLGSNNPTRGGVDSDGKAGTEAFPGESPTGTTGALGTLPAAGTTAPGGGGTGGAALSTAGEPAVLSDAASTVGLKPGTSSTNASSTPQPSSTNGTASPALSPQGGNNARAQATPAPKSGEGRPSGQKRR